MKKKISVVTLALLVLAVVMVSGCTSSDTASNSTKSTSGQSSGTANALTVENLKIVSQGYGSYDIKADITPNKDFSYLEMVTIAYDSSGAVIEKSPLVWNINDAQAGQKYKVTGMMYISGNEKPAKVDVLIFDSVFSSGDEEGYLYKKTVTV